MTAMVWRGRAAGLFRRKLSLILPALLLVACAGPGERSVATARDLGLDSNEVSGSGLPMVVFRNHAAATRDPLHVYIEGDGTPWVGNQPALDPGPRDPLALRLMVQDSAAALLLGRPCYHGTHRHSGCRAAWWTDSRYSSRVVDAMAEALSAVAPPTRPLMLIGYSGGGVLAMLLAERLENVETVVTIAANLDIDSWTKLRGYEPLYGSLNPARRPPLPKRIHQIHLAGGTDANVPRALTAAFAAMQPGAEIEIIENFDHACCWSDAWQRILANIRQGHTPWHAEVIRRSL